MLVVVRDRLDGPVPDEDAALSPAAARPSPAKRERGFPRHDAGVGQRRLGVGCSLALAPLRSLRRSLTRWSRVDGANMKAPRLGSTCATVAFRQGVSNAAYNGRDVFKLASTWPRRCAAMSKVVRVPTSSPRPTSLSNARVAAWEAPLSLCGRGARGSGGEGHAVVGRRPTSGPQRVVASQSAAVGWERREAGHRVTFMQGRVACVAASICSIGAGL
jgi:hypothetical protein